MKRSELTAAQFVGHDLRLSQSRAFECLVAARCGSMAFLALLLGACATTVEVTPKLGEPTSQNCEIHAMIRYEGIADYLPTVLLRESTVSQADITLRYGFHVTYDSQPLPDVATMVNPLAMFGFPTGHDYISVLGTLDFVQADATVRTYGAAAALRRTGTIFGEGDSFTDLRRRGLLLVRDNISAQLCRDQRALAQLLGAPAASPNPFSQSTSKGERQ
jgi:hypothetical protein